MLTFLFLTGVFATTAVVADHISTTPAINKHEGIVSEFLRSCIDKTHNPVFCRKEAVELKKALENKSPCITPKINCDDCAVKHWRYNGR